MRSYLEKVYFFLAVGVLKFCLIRLCPIMVMLVLERRDNLEHWLETVLIDKLGVICEH